MPKHILVLIHGITPEPVPDVLAQYDDLLGAVRAAQLPLAGPPCRVSWGVAPAEGVPRPDQNLSRAERFVGSLVSEQALDEAPPEEAASSLGTDWGIPGVRPLLTRVRESVVLYGLADALYYASAEGEVAVRSTVFSQVFDKLEASADGELHLHIVAHSLGVAVAHDFLYALFGSRSPDFPADATPGEVSLPAAIAELQRAWRREAIAGRLKLGTFISFASQMPLFVMRKQALVDRLARGERLDPRLIGIDPGRVTPQWAIFYDSDELLGFATRRLYQPTPAIIDIHANSGVEPLSAHLGYWHRKAILERCVALLRSNMA